MEDATKAKVFAMMAEAAPIAQNLVEVMETKKVPVQTWMVAMAISMLSVEISNKPVTPEFISGIFKTIYALQQQSSVTDTSDKANAS